MKEMMTESIQQALPFFLAAVVAFAISCILTPAAIRLAPKIGAMDIPKDNRRMHKKAMPRFGGMAIFAGTEISLALFCHSDPKVITILIGGLLIYAVGVVDDLRGIPAKLKFLLQMLCAVVLYVGGIRVDFVKNPLSLFIDGAPEYLHFPLAVSVIITVIWIVGITNTVNLIDGLDGLAAGVAAIASGYISYAAILSGQYGVALAMIAVTGGALGFLPFNFHPAKIFMGDSGSLYLGFMIAAISVLGSTKGATLIVTIVPFLALGLPIFDTAFAIIRRWMNGTPIMEADKGHVHHRIMNTGIGQRRTVLIMYCISAVMGMVAIMVVKREFLEAFILTAVAAALLCVFVADHSGMRAIMQEGITSPAKDDSTEQKKDCSADTGNTAVSKAPEEDNGETAVEESPVTAASGQEMPGQAVSYAEESAGESQTVPQEESEKGEPALQEDADFAGTAEEPKVPAAEGADAEKESELK